MDWWAKEGSTASAGCLPRSLSNKEKKGEGSKKAIFLNLNTMNYE